MPCKNSHFSRSSYIWKPVLPIKNCHRSSQSLYREYDMQVNLTLVLFVTSFLWLQNSIDQLVS